MARLPATTKRKAGPIKDSANKKLKRQSDLQTGFATQILKSPRKFVDSKSAFINQRRLEVEDEIEISSDEDDRHWPGTVQDSPLRKTVGKKEAPTFKVESLELSQLPLPSTGIPSKSTSTQTDNSTEDIPWLARVPLRKAADLAVHKKKVTDVQNWIEGAFQSIAKKTVLILTGPAGVGKTATVETLAHVLDYDVIEWKNPMSAEWSQDRANRDADSLAQKFERFLSISDKYSALDFGDGLADRDTDHRRKVIVVEDIPNTFSSSSHMSSARLAFQNSIVRYLSSPRGKYPLILIITETEPRGEEGDWNRFDAMSLRTLLNRDILDAHNCSHIAFNEVAPTFISKALSRLVDSLPRSEALDISQAVLDEISQTANGDIRSAINTLQFIAHRFSTHGRAPKARRKRKRAEVLTLSPEETAILNIITNRESALGYFHAIGKVIYNKRSPSAGNITPSSTSLPDHLRIHERERAESSVESILDETSTDAATFLQGIHQNYIPSTTTVEQCADLLDALSVADLMRTVHGESGITGVLGAMHALPSTVKRAYTAKIYFPAFKTLLRRQAEVRDALEAAAAAAVSATVTAPAGSRDGAGTTSRASPARDAIEYVSYHSLILQQRGESGFPDAVQFERFSNLGRGGAESTQALVREEGAVKQKRRSKKEELILDEGELSDEIEEVE